MKLLAFNGSPKKEGNTWHSLSILSEVLKEEGVETSIVHVGNKNIRGCLACGKCRELKNGKCIQDKDPVNEWIALMQEADAIVLASPVYFSAIAGTMKAFLDRAFYVAGANSHFLRHKIGASIVALRRSGGVTTFNQLNNYLLYAEMVLAGSSYWNVIYGTNPGEVRMDTEGLQIIRHLGRNIAWLLKLVKNSEKTLAPPEREEPLRRNFIT